MSDMTANTSRNLRSRAQSIALPTTSSEEYYVGSAIGLDLSTGRAVALSTVSAEDVRFVGWCERRVTGDGSNFVAVRADGPVVESAAVTGASAATDAGKLVYMTDDQTFTLTRPAADAVPVGVISRYRSGTSCDVICFTLGEAMAMDSSRPKETVLLGSVGLNTIAANDVVCRRPMWGHGKIVGFHAYPSRVVPSGSTGSSVFEMLQGATSVGDLALTASTGASGMQDFTAAPGPSVEQRFSDGDVVTVKLKTATTVWNSSGAVSFFADVVPG